MKKTVSFTKDLEFPTMIGEITEISIEDDFKFIDQSNINGNFFINGKYKMTEASRLEEDFSFNLPIDISLTQKLELDTSSIEISDFTYDIVDEVILRCNIDVLIQGREVIEIEEVEEIEAKKEEDRECDGDKEKEEELPIKDRNNLELEEQKFEVVESLELPKELEKNNNDDKMTTNSLFSNLADEDDSFSTYSIYIMREEDMLEKVIEKYKVTKDILMEYNDLSNIEVNSKIIIPNTIDE